jgi:hypothetical protein
VLAGLSLSHIRNIKNTVIDALASQAGPAAKIELNKHSYYLPRAEAANSEDAV